MGTGALSPAVKRLGSETDNSPSSSAEVENEWSYTSTPHTFSWRDALLSTETTLPLPLSFHCDTCRATVCMILSEQNEHLGQ
jgi:hypothetical protein